jgi:hypothetical protein
VVAGMPARIVKMRFDHETCEALESIAWWTWPLERILESVELLNSCTPDQLILLAQAGSRATSESDPGSAIDAPSSDSRNG